MSDPHSSNTGEDLILGPEATSEEMYNAILRWVDKVTTILESGGGPGPGPSTGLKPILFQTGTLNPGDVVTYDLSKVITSMGDYTLATVIVDLKIIDPETTSPTSGKLISASASIGWDLDSSTGILNIRGYSLSVPITYYIRVDSPIKTADIPVYTP
ncbi:hypothetical protein I5G20_14805 [Pseudomonas aeruginosa]|nr:hypothetical protein [Pseudomonas aeruginosa]